MSKTKSAAPEQHVLRFGNPLVHEPVSDKFGGEVKGYQAKPELGEQVTEVRLPAADAQALIDGHRHLAAAFEQGSRESVIEHIRTNTEGVSTAEPWEIATRHLRVVLGHHARAGVSWVACENAKLRAAAAEVFGCPQLDDLLPGGSEALEAAALEKHAWPEILEGIEGPTALKTKGGVDVIAEASFGTAAQPAALNYIAQTANNEAESASNTSLAGEITTGGGGLIRKQATFAHTTGLATATLTVTFTANGSDTLPVTVNKVGYFNKVTSGGTMGLEDKLSSGVTYNAIGDNSTITNTLTIS